jgi:hypothetical protein
MRRLVIELSIKEWAKPSMDEESKLAMVKSIDILHILKNEPDEFVAIFRIELKDSGAKIEDFLDDGEDVQFLEKEKDGVSILFVRVKPKPSPFFDYLTGGYLFGPIEVRDGRVKLTFLGSAKQVKDYLKKVESKGLHYKLVSLTDAKFSPDSPLARLTEKQQTVLTTAFSLGYYDVPRRISSAQLARKLNLVSSTLVAHRRKAERRLIADVLGRR